MTGYRFDSEEAVGKPPVVYRPLGLVPSGSPRLTGASGPPRSVEHEITAHYQVPKLKPIGVRCCFRSA